VLCAMTAVTRLVEWMLVAAARLDPESAEWLRVLGHGGQQRVQGLFVATPGLTAISGSPAPAAPASPSGNPYGY
jgi:hypothetical protein